MNFKNLPTISYKPSLIKHIKCRSCSNRMRQFVAHSTQVAVTVTALWQLGLIISAISRNGDSIGGSRRQKPFVHLENYNALLPLLSAPLCLADNSGRTNEFYWMYDKTCALSIYNLVLHSLDSSFKSHIDWNLFISKSSSRAQSVWILCTLRHVSLAWAIGCRHGSFY